MKKCTHIIATFALSLLISCASEKKHEIDIEKVRNFIATKNALWSVSISKYDFPTILSIYTSDATLMPPNSPMVRGKNKIKAYYERMPVRGVKITNSVFTTIDLTLKDSTAYEIGNYSMNIDRPGMATLSDTGKYSTVWKLQTDGTWKIYIDCWNSNKPLQLLHQDRK